MYEPIHILTKKVIGLQNMVENYSTPNFIFNPFKFLFFAAPWYTNIDQHKWTNIFDTEKFSENEKSSFDAEQLHKP